MKAADPNLHNEHTHTAGTLFRPLCTVKTTREIFTHIHTCRRAEEPEYLDASRKKLIMLGNFYARFPGRRRRRTPRVHDNERKRDALGAIMR